MTGAPLVVLDGGDSGGYRGFVWSPDGTVLITWNEISGDRSQVQAWDTTTGQEIRELPSAHSDHIKDVAFNPDGTKMATASDDNTVIIWDALRYYPLGILYGDPAKNDHVYVSAGFGDLVWSPDGTMLAGATEYGIVRVWRIP